LTVGRVARETVVIPGLVKMEAFGRLVDFLCEELGYTEGVDLLEFGYDWRQDNRASAALLKERVTSWRLSLPDPHTKIVFIGHSMGGLICRYYLEQLGGLDACARLILLGTPNRGSTRILSTAISGRGALAVPIGAARIRRMMLHFPSVYQLLPTHSTIRLESGEIFLPFSDDGWLPAEFRSHLPTGRSFRATLESTERSGVPTTCVFGYGQRTLVEMRVRREPDGSFKVIEEIFDEAGDDAVTESSAVLDRAEIHPVRQRHGALYGDQDVQRRLRYELLERPR
jgi:pimeloyl-ACP methyl ester carboxylesterase